MPVAEEFLLRALTSHQAPTGALWNHHMTLEQLVRHHANDAREYLRGILRGDVMNDRKPAMCQVSIKTKHRPPDESKSHAATLRRLPAGLAIRLDVVADELGAAFCAQWSKWKHRYSIAIENARKEPVSRKSGERLELMRDTARPLLAELDNLLEAALEREIASD